MQQRGPEGKGDPSIRLILKIAARERFPLHSAQAGLLLTQHVVSRRRFEVGGEPEITRPFAAGEPTAETPGKIAGSAEDTGGCFYGVERKEQVI